jgi:D-alanyl-D-alanine carboxypeptidase/D-alanyl-D-alanine-endopeptidase (penicillin-binding protein 4)
VRTGKPLVPALALAALAAHLAAPARAAEPSRKEALQQLRAALAEILSSSALANARAGVAVASLETGEILYAHNPDELLNPASNVKLFTTAAALARLGPEYRFETEFHVEPATGGAVVRNLYVRGKGDPTFVSERLWEVAGELYHLGLRAVKGDLVVDDSWFDDEREGPGFDQESGDRSYLAPAGALSLNFNSVAIHVAPGGKVGEKGRVELEPMSDFFQLDNRTATVRAGARRRVTPSSIALGSRQRILVEARLPLGSRPQAIWRKIDSPALYFGHTLKRFLDLRGVKVQGKVRRGTVPDGARLLHVAESESLGEAARRLNKTSNNFVAEQILKTLGAEVKGPPGTWPKGVEASEEFLAEAGLERGTYIMKNGSGLNDANRFSARQTVKLLREMWRRFPLMAEFVSALPVAGKDGTIRWRMEGSEAVGRLRAKTGTLENVTSLSGYVETKGKERLAFAVIVNDYAGKAPQITRAVDALGSALAAAGGEPAELGEAVALATAPATPAPGAAEDAAQRAHVATYRRLGAAGDRRNLPLLRTAVRSERDPVVRAVAAEAVYLSDPYGETARRTFLEAVPADPEVLLRLRAAAGPDAPSPLLGSLADLAAEGVPEALSRLVELSPAGSRDPALDSEISETWVEVARTAPDETLAALRAASEAGSAAALSALARGLARAREPSHPFAVAVRRAAAEGDGDLAGFARALAPKLTEQREPAEAPLGGARGPAPEGAASLDAGSRPGGG